ncbi:MAG TPA: hypothetical protein VMF31_11075 [Solirubrobacterales bacterium]|nr:hypothetical protein [Solirubrobacterales bacterium]
MRAESGQASVEAVAGIAVLVLGGLVCFQLLATGYSVTVADGAATAGAVALVRGDSVKAAVKEALPGWANSRVSVRRVGEKVEVSIRPPSPFTWLSERIELTSGASARSK